MKYGELTLGQMEALVNKLGGMDGVKRILAGDLIVKAKEIVASTLALVVNYSRSLSEAIAFGKYDWVNEDIIVANFPSTQSGEAEIEVKLVHFGKVMSTNQILRALDEQGLRPATLPELLAIGEKYPELQREFPIVALGSSWVDRSGDRSVAYLSRGGGGRLLRLSWCEGDWGGRFRFAAVSK